MHGNNSKGIGWYIKKLCEALQNGKAICIFKKQLYKEKYL